MSVLASQISRPSIEGGYTSLENVFSLAEIASARHGQEELIAGRADIKPDFAWPSPRARNPRSWKMPYSTSFRSELRRLAHSPQLLQAIATQTGARSIRLWFDQLLWESPAPSHRPGNYHWHTERSRWLTCQSPLMVTAWIPLAPLLPKMGPITMARGTASHQWRTLPRHWSPHPSEILPAPVQPRDAALFCWHTVHGNPPNTSSAPRRAIAIHYAIDGLSYRAHGPFRHSNERLVGRRDGLPDFQDERVCPLLYQEGLPPGPA